MVSVRMLRSLSVKADDDSRRFSRVCSSPFVSAVALDGVVHERCVAPYDDDNVSCKGTDEAAANGADDVTHCCVLSGIRQQDAVDGDQL